MSDKSEYWSDKTGGGLPSAIIETVDSIKNDQESYSMDYRRWAGLYLDRNVEGFLPGEWMRYSSSIDEAADELDMYDSPSWNVTRACVDSVTAKLTMRKIDPWYQTFGADELLSEQAKLREQFARTILESEGSHKSMRQNVKIACINGTGFFKTWWSTDGEIHIDWVFTDRIIVDNQAALRGDPACMFHEDFYTKQELIAMFPDKRDVIEAAKCEDQGSTQTRRQMVRVIEAWKRKLGKEDKGKRAIVVDTGSDKRGLLLEKDYEHRKFPVTPIRWQDDLMGYYGLSGVSVIESCQHDLNFALEMIKGNLDHFGHPFLWIDKAASIKDADVETNERYKIIEGVGQPPQVITPPIVHDQVFMWANLLWDRAFELFGLSQLTATSQKPPGLRSGTALRTYHDIETERFSEVALQKQRAIVDLTWQIERCANEMQAAGITPTVIVADEDGVLKKIKWPKNTDENRFRVSVYPGSSLPQQPGGRVDKVIEWMERGLIDQNYAIELSESPDLEKYRQMVTAARDDLMVTFEHMLSEDGEYVEPFEWQDLTLGIQMGTSYYLRARINGIAKERLDRVEQWLYAAHAMLTPAQPVAAPQISGELPADPAAAQMLTQAQATGQGGQ